MADKQNNVVLNFKMEGQVQYASTLKDINAIMNTAAKEYKNQIAAMGQDASATDKLTAEKKKLEIQMEAAQKRTELLRNEFEEMSKDTNTSTAELTKMYSKLLDSENAENALQSSLDRVNNGLSDQAQASRDNLEAMTKLQDESSDLQLEMDKLNSEYELQKSQLGENAAEAEKNALAQEHLAKQSDVTEKQIANMEQQLEVTKREYGENSAEVQKMEIALNEAKTSFNNLGHEMEGVSEESETARTGIGKLATVFEEEALEQASEKFAEIGEKLKELGEQAVDAFQEVKSGQDTVVETTGTTGKTLDSLIKSFHNLFKDVPDDAEEVGTAIGLVHTQFGLLGKDLEEKSDLFLRFATINKQDVTSSVQDARQAMEAYGLKAEDLDTVLDSVTKTSQETSQSTGDLFSKVIEGAPQIKALGLSFADGTALIGKFEQAGVDSGSALASLSKATVTYAKQHKTLQQGLAGTIDKIKNSKNETVALNEAATAFGTRGAPRMLDAIKRGTLNFNDLGKATDKATGAVNKTYEETEDVSKELKKDLNAIKDDMSGVGESIEETLEPILKKLSKFLTSVADGFNRLSPGLKDFITILGVVTAGMLIFMPIVLATAIAVTTLDGAFLPIILTMAAIVLGVTLVIVAFKNWGAIVKWFKGLWGEFKDWIANIWQSIKDTATKVWGSIKDFFKKWGLDLLAILTGPAGAIVLLVVEIVKNWGKIKDTAGKIWGDIKGKVVDEAGKLKDGAVNEYNKLKTGAQKVLEKHKDNMLKDASDIKTGFVSKMGDLKDGAISHFDSLRTKTKNIIGDVKSFFSNLKLKIPKPSLPPLPHFSLEFSSKTIFGKTIKFPSGLDVDWRAKGAIFTRPTIFGASGGKLQGAGDAGAEAALPLNDETLGAIGEGIARTMGSNGQPIIVQLVANSKVLAQTVVDDITALQVSKQKEADDFAGLPRRG